MTYDTWKATDPADRWGYCETCPECSEPLERRHGDWRCDRCDDEMEYRERQLEEQD